MIIWLNGVVGSGKSAVGAALACLLPGGHFIDGDDHAGPADLPDRWRWRIALLTVLTLARRRPPARIVVAYPLDSGSFRILRSRCARVRRRLVVINLATPLPVVLRGRGGRVLSRDERRRVREMVGEGYCRRRFATMTLCNALPPPARTARVILHRLRAA